MNRRGFLSLSLLAPVAGVMAARDAMAAHSARVLIPARGEVGECFIGESIGEPVLRFRPIKVRPADLEYLESRRFAAREIFGGAS